MTDKMLHTMTESRLNDLALITLNSEKIIEMFVQANHGKLKLKRVGEHVDGVNSN